MDSTVPRFRHILLTGVSIKKDSRSAKRFLSRRQNTGRAKNIFRGRASPRSPPAISPFRNDKKIQPMGPEPLGFRFPKVIILGCTYKGGEKTAAPYRCVWTSRSIRFCPRRSLKISHTGRVLRFSVSSSAGVGRIMTMPSASNCWRASSSERGAKTSR